MAEATIHAPTRELRGLQLYRERGDEIERILPHTYSVPSCTGSTAYVVRLAPREYCDCPDFERHHTACKHVYAASIFRAKLKRQSA